MTELLDLEPFICDDCLWGFGGGNTWECPLCHEELSIHLQIDDAIFATGEYAYSQEGVTRTIRGWKEHWENVAYKIDQALTGSDPLE